MGTMWGGGAMGAQGASWILVLCQQGVKVQCVGDAAVPPSRAASLIFSFSVETLKPTGCQPASRRSFDAAASSCILLLLSLDVGFSLQKSTRLKGNCHM